VFGVNAVGWRALHREDSHRPGFVALRAGMASRRDLLTAIDPSPWPVDEASIAN